MPESSLPAQATTFVGRVEELNEIAALLGQPDCRLLTLVGPGGIGKTRLALATADLFAPENAVFVPLQQLTSPDFLVSTIADALGYQFYGGSDPTQQLLDYLRDKTWQLILDNFEHLLEGAALLSKMLAYAPGVKLLVTSRERLNLIEEWVFEVGGLAYPADEHRADAAQYGAMELFVQRAQRAKTGFRLSEAQRPIVARICRLVGGMPLGIELAAAWVRALSCEAIADEIEHSLDILESPARNVEPRHRTMRAAFEPTWNRLPDDERDVFMRLSVFRGGFSREAAEQVAGAALHTLSVLVDKSLLHIDAHGRYDLHELLRQYGEEQLTLSGQHAMVRDGHSAYVAAFLQQKWQPLRSHQQLETLDEIELEFENIRTAWQWMVERCKTAEISRAVYSLWYFSDLRGRFSDVLPMFKQAEDALRPLSGDADAERVVGQMLTRRSWFYFWMAKLDEAHVVAEEGLAIMRRIGSPQDIAMALDSLCLIEAFAHNWVALKRHAEEEAVIARSIQDEWQLVRALFPRTNAAYFANDWADAQQAAQEFRIAAEACGDVWMKAMSCYVQMDISEAQGNYAEAKRQCERGIELLVSIRQGFFVGVQYRDLGRLDLRMKNYQLAAQHFQQGLKLLLDTGGFRYFLLDCFPLIAHLWSALGKFEQALELVALVIHHSESWLSTRSDALPILSQLQAELTPQAFTAVREHGKTLGLDSVVKQLIVQLGELAHVPTLAVLPPNGVSIEQLTPRELEILHLVAAGYSNNEIADRLSIGVSTVKKHINHIFDKLNAKNRTQAVVRARAQGLFSKIHPLYTLNSPFD